MLKTFAGFADGFGFCFALPRGFFFFCITDMRTWNTAQSIVQEWLSTLQRSTANMRSLGWGPKPLRAAKTTNH